MKLASYKVGGRDAWGVVVNEKIVSDLSERWIDLRSAMPLDLEEISEASRSAPRHNLQDVELAPVVPNPGKILCVGHNYESHRVETGRDRTDHPSIFVRFADTLVANGRPIAVPPVSTQLDYEGELLVVIGKTCHEVAESDALDHVAGYSCFNDASLRDWQWHTKQFTPGKNFSATGGCGPYLVTPDEVGDPAGLSVTTRLNGKVMQSQPTAEMIFSIPAVIAYVSTFTRLAAGDLIASGTPGGVGAKRTPPVWMRDGDVVEVEIPRVGLLVNPVRDRT